jgi:hypothetical protein
MADATEPSFGDNVVIRATPETVSAGVAGKTGSVSGFTTPSVTRVDVVGGTAQDYALAVMFDDETPDAWFREDLIEFVDHGAGREIRIGDMKAVRAADGSWVETRLNGTPLTSKEPMPKEGRPWWKLW